MTGVQTCALPISIAVLLADLDARGKESLLAGRIVSTNQAANTAIEASVDDAVSGTAEEAG